MVNRVAEQLPYSGFDSPLSPQHRTIEFLAAEIRLKSGSLPALLELQRAAG